MKKIWIKLMISFLIFFISNTLFASDDLRNPQPFQKDKLIFAIDVIRHGDRNPTIDIPTAPHHWTEGLGQLTPIGMRQEYELGKKFRRRYVDKEELLPKEYQSGTLYVRSSDMDRTLMSAECVLIGLYPPGTGPLVKNSFLSSLSALPYRYQPIPIHTVPEDHDDLLLLTNETASHLNKLLKKHVYSTAEWKKKMAELKPHFSAWSKATGVPEDQLDQVTDPLFIYQLKHIPLPDALSKHDVEEMIHATDWMAVTTFKNQIIGNAILGGNLLKRIALYLQQAAAQNTSLKYVLYSAHDVTLMALMSAMGVPLNEVPQYASDINIALYHQKNGGNYIQVTYNHEPIRLPCSQDVHCSLKQFLSLVKEK